MKLSPSSQWHVERAHREEGLQNPDDLNDATTMAEAREEAEHITAGIEVRVDRTPSEAAQETLRDLQECTRALSEAFQSEFRHLLDRYQQERTNIPPRVVKYLLERGHDLPKFVIFDAERGKEYLSEQGFSNRIPRDGFLLLFQLPKPLAHFWFKGPYNDADGEQVDLTRGEVTEWGWFYDRILPTIWRGVDGSEKFWFDRINEVGQHPKDEYYYLWSVRPKTSMPSAGSWPQGDEPEDQAAA